MTQTLRLAALALVLTACGEASLEDAEGGDTLFSEESNVVVGQLNWKSATLLAAGSGEARNARAVGYLSIPAKGTRCTAWLIASDKIVTNNHCIASATEAAGARVSFNYEDGVASSSRVWFDCSTFLKTWSDVDATVLKCAARNGVLPGQTYGTLSLAGSNASTGSSIYVVHQNCDYYSGTCTPTKKYSPGVVKNGSYTTREITYDADTLGGSSGSPVFNASHQVVALHHVGLNGDAKGRGTANAGVKVTALKARLAEVGL